MLISVGVPLAIDGGLYNCAVTLFGGRPVAATAKASAELPGFYELRWFRPAAEASLAEIDLLGEQVPFGRTCWLR
jgi:NAD+ synthase (glutamine-hydrolysing)